MNEVLTNASEASGGRVLPQLREEPTRRPCVVRTALDPLRKDCAHSRAFGVSALVRQESLHLLHESRLRRLGQRMVLALPYPSMRSSLLTTRSRLRTRYSNTSNTCGPIAIIWPPRRSSPPIRIGRMIFEEINQMLTLAAPALSNRAVKFGRISGLSQGYVKDVPIATR
jgi:hypothetical protein